MVQTGFGQFRRLFDVIFNPQRLIQTPSGRHQASFFNQIRIIGRTSVFFIANVVLYAFPLALAGVGFVGETEAPDLFTRATQSVLSNPDNAWMILLRLVNNSLILTTIGIITFVTYHLGIWITRSSNGVILSYRIVTINTSIYLAVIFNLAWFAANHDQVRIIGDLIDWALQRHFELVANVLPASSPFRAAGERPELADISLLGELILVGLIVSLCYYLYVLYIGSISAHGATRYEAAIVVSFMIFTPVLYAISTIMIGETITLPSVATLNQ